MTCDDALKMTKWRIFKKTAGCPIFALHHTELRKDLNSNRLLVLVVAFREANRVQSELESVVVLGEVTSSTDERFEHHAFRVAHFGGL